MRFNELYFFVFIALFFSVYSFLRGRTKLYFLLVASYFFYGWWDWRFLGVLWFTTAMDYTLGRLIESAQGPAKRRLMLASVVANLSLLGYFKYCNFFIESAGDFLSMLGLHVSLPVLNVVLPIGISFYTFMSMSYTIDVYRGDIKAERDWLRFSVFVCFFPHLVAGPILRPDHFLPQLREVKKASGREVVYGLCWIALGYVKKVVVADTLAVYVDRTFANPELGGGAGLFVGAVFYAFQIYGDFSGYSDIAYGLAKIMGFDIGRNFKRPYLSQDFSEFWRRWHISLSQWLRDYLYISMGGNRGGRWQTMRNLFLTMLLGGLWHGPNWTFLVWGGLHGLFLIGQRSVPKSWLKSPESTWISSAARIVIVFSLVTVTWVFFRSPSLDFALDYLIRTFTQPWSLGLIQHKFLVAKGGALLCMLICIELVAEKWSMSALVDRRPYLVSLFIGVALCLIALAGSFDGGHFIYFQF